MKRTTILIWLTLALLLSAAPARAQSGDYELDWWTVDGGGMIESETNPYSLSGTIGQADAAHWGGSEPGSYALSGGG